MGLTRKSNRGEIAAMNFKEFMLLEAKEIPWSNADTGWWEDQDPVILFHGTHERNIETIMKNGLDRKDPQTGFISLALEPHTAKGYASMSGVGGESDFRKAGAKVKSTPMSERAVFVFEIPQKWIQENMDKNLSGNVGDAKKRMQSKEEYELFKQNVGKPDYVYYQLAELRVKKEVPAKFIKGIMRPK